MDYESSRSFETDILKGKRKERTETNEGKKGGKKRQGETA
jgi:hypothetical protein